jgi:hypothetical protein
MHTNLYHSVRYVKGDRIPPRQPVRNVSRGTHTAQSVDFCRHRIRVRTSTIQHASTGVRYDTSNHTQRAATHTRIGPGSSNHNQAAAHSATQPRPRGTISTHTAEDTQDHNTDHSPEPPGRHSRAQKRDRSVPEQKVRIHIPRRLAVPPAGGHRMA